MNYSDKLIEFIDNELPKEDEIELFSAISKDDSLREEFKNLIDLKGSIKKSQSYYEPSAAMTAAIFRELNISLPPNTIQTTPVKANPLKNVLHIKSMFYGAMITLFTIVPGLFFAAKYYQKPPVSQKESVIQSASIPKIESNNIEQQSERSKIKTLTKIVYVDRKQIEIPEINNNNICKADLSLTQPMQSFNNYKINNSLSKNNTLSNLHREPRIQDILQDSNNIGLSIEFRGSECWNIPSETISPSYLAKFHNTGVSLFYNISDNFILGADLRQETFFVKYRGYKDTILYNYEQQPNLTSIGISARYILPVMTNLNFLTQLNFGINGYGWLIRPMTGLSYELSDNISFLASFEYSQIWFQHQHNWFNSSKVGINYGINYKF